MTGVMVMNELVPTRLDDASSDQTLLACGSVFDQLRFGCRAKGASPCPMPTGP